MSLDPNIPKVALDNLPVNVALLEDDGTLIWANEAWRTFASEHNPENLVDFVGHNYLDVSTDDEYAQQAVEGLTQLLNGERETFELEYPCHGPETKRWFLMWASCFSFDEETYALVAHLDITDRVLTERELGSHVEQMNDQRDHLALLNQLVRHDIRNDIQLVMSHAELLRDGLDPEEQTHVDAVLEQAEHIVDLTHAVKELEAAITGDNEPSLSAINLGAVLKAEVDKLHSTYDTGEKTISVSGPDEECVNLSVQANEMLASVLGNLLSNAVIHNDTDEPAIDIEIERNEETVTVRIADNGPGIPEKHWEKMFQRGQKGPQSSGTGFGLYLVDRLVDLYDGEVLITENEPRGTVFHVTLSLAEQTAPDW